MPDDGKKKLFLEKAINQIRKSYMNSGIEIISDEIIAEELWIPMRDKVKLRAVLYRPRNYKKLPLILQRTCYPQNDPFYRIHAEEFAKRGYAFLYEYCRGTGGSQGVWEPNINERQDGLDTMQWLEQQDWVDCIGYWGDSYLAFTGWIIADAVTPKVKSMCLCNYGTDRYTSAYEKRLFRHDILTSWAMENAGFKITADYLDSCRYRPHDKVDEALWGKKLDWYRQWITNTKRKDNYWSQGLWKELKEIPAKVKIPVYIQEGWFDHHMGSALVTWNDLSNDAKNHSWLEIGPLNHFGQNSITSYQPENLLRSKCPNALEWFELTLKRKIMPEKSVNLYVIGEDKWEKVKDWPYPGTEKKTFFLNEGNLISEKPGTSGYVAYIYDPDNPVPSRGAEAMLHTYKQIGSLIQPDPGYRDDVITFQSGILKSDLKLFGKIKVNLWISSDAGDTAFTAKLMEVEPDGRAYNIRSSITTIAADVKDYTPDTITEVHIDFWDIAWTIKKGCRLRLDISSSDFPQYAVHSNYPGVWASASKTKKAKQKIYYGEKTPSAIEIETLV